MIQKLLFLLLFFLSIPTFAQVHYETIQSKGLNASKELKIQLPRNYKANTKKTYPLIIVLDGDYLFEPMAGNVDLLSYWHEMPEAIVVGINQKDSRRDNTFYNDVNYLPAKTGADFFEFVGMELMPFLNKKYRISDFRAIAGHDATANFLNYYLFKSQPLFDAYINFSPELAPKMTERLVETFRKSKENRWFYLATSSGDDQVLREGATELNEKLSALENPVFHYRFDHFDEASHFALIAQAVPLALQSIFKDYSPINDLEYEQQILTLESSPVDYLIKKYKRLEDYYDMEMPIRVTDFLAVGKACEILQNWDELERLASLARDHYPNTMLGTYYKARAYEAYGRSMKAMETYQSAYGQEEVSYITTDYMLARAEKIKRDFNY